jgi:hypothetical protein
VGNLTELYKASSKAMDITKYIAPGMIIGGVHSLRMKRKRKAMEKKALLPLVPLLAGAGIGAMGGALTAPKGQRLSGALMGGAFGALTGGYGGAAMAGGKALLGGAGRSGAMSAIKGFTPKIAPTAKGMAGRALGMTGIGAMATGAMGGYNQSTVPRHGGQLPPQGYMNRPFY